MELKLRTQTRTARRDGITAPVAEEQEANKEVKRPDGIVWRLSGQEFRTDVIHAGILEDLAGVGSGSVEDLQAYFSQMAANPLKGALDILTALFDDSGLIPEAHCGSWSQKRRWARRLVGLGDMESFATTIAESMPVDALAAMGKLFPQGMEIQTSGEPSVAASGEEPAS